MKGSGIAVDRITGDGTVTVSDTSIYGGTLPHASVDAHLANGAAHGRATGEFRDFDPARVSKNPQYKGHVSGTVNTTFAVASIAAPITPDAITADGRVTLAPSEIAGLRSTAPTSHGQYANRRGTSAAGHGQGARSRCAGVGPDRARSSGPVKREVSRRGHESRDASASSRTSPTSPAPPCSTARSRATHRRSR